MLRLAVIALIVGDLAAARLAGITPDIGQAEDKPLAEQVKPGDGVTVSQTHEGFGIR
jgi:hypothetical protein